MAHRIAVGLLPGFKDAAGEKIHGRIIDDLGIETKDVRTVHVFTLDIDLSPDELSTIAENLFVDPIIHHYTVDAPLADNFDYLVEVGFLPGVTDNVGRTATEGVNLIFPNRIKADERVHSSVQYLISGNITPDDVNRIATGLLANSLIQRFVILDKKTFDSQGGVEISVPRVSGQVSTELELIDLEIPDDALVSLSRNRVLALSLEEMRAIQEYFRDERVIAQRASVELNEKITDMELEALAQTWSEHCKHKIFAA